MIVLLIEGVNVTDPVYELDQLVLEEGNAPTDKVAVRVCVGN